MPVVLVCAGLGAVRVQRTSDQRWPYVLMLLWVATPILIPLAVSITIRPVLELRYLVVCVPGVALLAGTLIANLLDASNADRLLCCSSDRAVWRLGVFYPGQH